MPLAIRRAGKHVAVSSDCSEAYQQVDDDLGRLVQWTLGSPQERWEVRYVFTHIFGPNGGTVLGLGFGLSDVRLEEVDILADDHLVVCDAYDGEVNVLGEQSAPEQFDLSEPATSAIEESIMAVYDSAMGMVRFTVTSPRCRGSATAEIVRDNLKGLELYPTACFANSKSRVRVEVTSALMAMPSPICRRLLRTDFSSYMDNAKGPSGRVSFRVEGRLLHADRFLLAARSEYFEKMLRAGMAEDSASEIPIPRASHAAFEAVLRFLYSAGQAGERLFKHADPLEVLHLSVEFLLDDLSRVCEWKLMQDEDLSVENTLATFGSIVAVRNKAPVLAEACVERLQGRMHEVCGTRAFRELCRREDAVCELLIALDEPNAKRRKSRS